MERITTDRISSTLASVQQFFARDVQQFRRQLAELDSQIDPAALPRIGDAFHHRIWEAFEQSREACGRFEAAHGDDPVVIGDVQAGFRQETAEWFDRSWIAHRSRTKPHGFAGDYEMLIQLYEETTPARGLGGYLDLCILDLPLARAVRARLKAAREFLLSETISRSGLTRVLDVACGPCREYIDWPGNRQCGDIEVVAMDSDPRALDYVNTHVLGKLPYGINVQAIRYNALRTRSSNTTIRKFGKFDIIYSVGLFDYLPDDQLIPIIGALQDTLCDGGILYIAFKDCEQYDKVPYQWHLDWHFYQRTEIDCKRLYQRAGIPADVINMSRDETGIIMNMVTRKRETDRIRTDMPERLPARLGGHLPMIKDKIKEE